jgi:hypothetical protein
MLGLDFAPAVIYSSGGPDASLVAVADVNGDGKPDLLAADDCASGTEQGAAVRTTLAR